MTSRRRTTSNQHWSNVVYVNVEIYNVQQRWNNVVYFNIELNNVRQRQNNVYLNIGFHHVGQRRNNVANKTISQKNYALIQKQINIFELQGICRTQNLLQFFSILRGICKRIFAEPQKFRSSRPEVFLRKGVLKICCKFTGEHPCRSVTSMKLQSNLIEIALLHGCSPVNLMHIFKTPLLESTSRRLLLKILKTSNILTNKKHV